jgi:hypothetical protein
VWLIYECARKRSFRFVCGRENIGNTRPSSSNVLCQAFADFYIRPECRDAYRSMDPFVLVINKYF